MGSSITIIFVQHIVSCFHNMLNVTLDAEALIYHKNGTSAFHVLPGENTVYRATAFIVIEDHKKANQRFIPSVISIPLKHQR